MRTKSGLPKRKALRRAPEWKHGFRNNPAIAQEINPALRGEGGKQTTTVPVVSFFAGCGGLDLGLLGGFRFHRQYYEPMPFDIRAAYDIDEKAVETYKLNIGTHAHVQDLTQIDMTTVPAADVLFGGFPCQDFSSCGHKRGFAGERGQLYKCMIEYMKVHRPKVVVGENVPLLKGMKGGSLLVDRTRHLSPFGGETNPCPARDAAGTVRQNLTTRHHLTRTSRRWLQGQVLVLKLS